MTQIIQAFLVALFITFIGDFFLFLGIQLHYLQALHINEFYNILFADNQNIWLYLALSIVLTLVLLFVKNIKIKLSVIIAFISLSIFTAAVPSLGYKAGEAILMKKGQTFKDKRYTYHGDIYYNSRDILYFYDYDVKKLLKLNKKDLIL